MKRQFNPEKATKAQLKATLMPSLKHKTTDPFDITKSEVAIWLAKQPEILNAMFNHYKDSGAIVFDSAEQSWKGVNAP